MKMKLLDHTLICLLAGMSPLAIAEAQTTTPASDATGAASKGHAPVAPASDVNCDGGGCTSDEGLLMRVRTRGERKPVTEGTTAQSSSQALQPDRRVTVATEQPGKAVATGKWSVQLPNGGVIWATEDPNLGQPELSVSAPSLVAFDGQRIVKPIQFYSYNNYSAFIRRAEVLVFRATDPDLVSPIAIVPLESGAVTNTKWNGELPAGLALRYGDQLTYIVRAYGDDGAFDETYPRQLQLVRADEVERGDQLLRNSVESQNGTAFTIEGAQQQSLIQETFGQNALRQQNIAIYGSRIRIQGRNLPEGYALKIDGQSQPIDLERKLVAEYLVPIGDHKFDLELVGQDKRVIKHTLDVDVSGRYFFGVAIADLTLSSNSVTGSVEPFAGNTGANDDFLTEGRLAFYLKGKVQGKYLVTAQADTQEREVKDLFDGFWDAEPTDIFRRLDPDLYYPVYGDDSIVYRDVDTQGKLYLRVDWDKNQAIWGNFNTGITGTEYGQYSRALYGGAFNWRSRRTTRYGEPGTELRAFGSEAQTAPGHSEFLGTGTSVYSLKNTDILPGSDRVVIEVRDNTTGRVEGRTELTRGADYDIDELQGRIILERPLLSTVSRGNSPQLTTDTPLDGLTQVLLVDYEYVPTGFDPKDTTAGVRGKHWFGDHLGVGVTYVDENRAGDDYELRGGDITLQAGRGTYLKVEQTHTQATSAPVFFSTNGGLSFTELNSGLGARSGDASAVEARVNFKELGWTTLDWSAGAWWRDVDAGFSVTRFDQGLDIEEHGAEILGLFTPNLQVYARYSSAERGLESLKQAQFTAEWRIDDNNTLSGEVRRVEEDRTSGNFSDAAGTLAALRYLHRFGTSLEVYGTAQKTVDDDGGKYEDNDAATIGAKYLFGELSTVNAEVTTGDRGDAARINAEYRLTQAHSFYGGYTYSTDRTEYDPLFNDTQAPGWVFGQRWRLSNQINLYNETQFLKTPNDSGLANTFGMDFYPAAGWNTGFTLQDAKLDTAAGRVKRDSVSLSGGRTSNDTQWQSKVEWRRDTGAEQREQWVTTNRLLYKINESWRIAARINYSHTTDDIDQQAGAEFTEANVGFAWRPFDSTRWAVFGKYTFLYDVSTLPQVGDNVAFYDQRTNVVSLEGVFNPDNRWEYAAKLMQRKGEVRYGRLNGSWADATATFASGQLRYEFGGAWHALAEYRWLGVTEGGDRQGALLGIDRDIGRNFRVGVGYNFTQFSDDLTNFDYDQRGFFLNVVGKY